MTWAREEAFHQPLTLGGSECDTNLGTSLEVITGESRKTERLISYNSNQSCACHFNSVATKVLHLAEQRSFGLSDHSTISPTGSMTHNPFSLSSSVANS